MDDVESSHSQNIEKSYSNLSKDSGVLADSYHSDYSNSNCLLNGNTYLNSSQMDLADHTKLVTTVTKNSHHHHRNHHNHNNNDKVHNDDECSSNFGSTSSNDLSSEETTTTTTINLAPTTTNFASIKQSIDLGLNKKASLPSSSSSQQLNYRTHTKSAKKSQSNTNYFSDNQQIQPKKSNSNLSLSSISSSNSSSTPSPGSSSSGIGSDTTCGSNTNNSPSGDLRITGKREELMATGPPLPDSSDNTYSQQKSSPAPFFFNYNSLMNVSMLDSIQVTNNSLDLDNMSSSILMFN